MLTPANTLRLGIGVVIAAFACSVAHATVTDGLQAYWKLDETSGTTVVDSANSYDAVRSGNVGDGPVINQPGVIGKAYDFDQANDDKAYAATAPTIETTFTFTGWINAASTRAGTNSDSRSVIFGGQTTNGLQVAIGEAGTAGNPAKIITYDSSTTSKTAALISPGTWYHVAYTRNGANLVVYVDGIQVLTGATGAGNSALSDMLLGRYLANTARDWDGLLDDLGLWTTTKSAEEIALIHGLGLFGGVALDDSAIDDVLSVFIATSGSANAGGYAWSYVTGLASTTVGATGGSTGGLDAYIVLDSSGNGVQITALVPEPASIGLLGLGLLALARRRH